MQFFRRDSSSDEDKELEEFYRNLEAAEQAQQQEDTQQQEQSQQPQQEQSQLEQPQYGQQPQAQLQAEPQPTKDVSVTPQPEPSTATVTDPAEQYRQNATVIAKDTAFNGSLKSDSNLYIEGDFEGELEAQSTIFIAEAATVKADLRATDVVVAGKLTGTVDASNRFQAMASAQVSGEINSAVLVVEEEATINCSFAMKSREEYYH